MNRPHDVAAENPSRPRRRLAACAIAVGLIGTTFAGQAVAGCGQYDPGYAPPANWERLDASPGGLMKAGYRPGASGFLRVADDRDPVGAKIVGTWRFTFVSDGTAYPVPIPFGALVDFGTVQWHSDGTEFMISGGRAPSTGDVCMGAWEQTGPHTYTLKHIALAWVGSDSTPPAPAAAFLGPAIIREVVTIDRAGDRYEGSFTIDQYARDEVTLLEHIGGKVTGTRFTAH